MDHLILSPILLPYRRNRQNWTRKMKISWISCCWCQENKSYSTFPSSGVFQPGLRHSATRKLRLTPLSLSPPVSCVCLTISPPSRNLSLSCRTEAYRRVLSEAVLPLVPHHGDELKVMVEPPGPASLCNSCSFLLPLFTGKIMKVFISFFFAFFLHLHCRSFFFFFFFLLHLLRERDLAGTVGSRRQAPVTDSWRNLLVQVWINLFFIRPDASEGFRQARRRLAPIPKGREAAFSPYLFAQIRWIFTHPDNYQR